ncbi:MAG TPA: DNA mismatch repair protein [Natrialbaceae archaeon]|nr:DNA mismatch repair protein [Natrialbaceae archaeon]
MRLEDYWGVGPKTRAQLESSIGTAAAIDAIEGADVRTLVEAGLSRGRATRILRHAIGGAGLDTLATSDTRSVYKDVIDLAVEHAVTAGAADRIRVLTPLSERESMIERLDAVLAVRDAWADLDGDARAAVLDAFDTYDEAGESERAAVEAALALREAGLESGPFERIADLDPDGLRAAADALAGLEDGEVREGVDDELDRRREALAAVDRLKADALDVIETLRATGARNTDEFREAFVEYVREETDVDPARVRETAPDGATDVTDFVGEGLRELADDLAADVEERAATVREDLETDVAEAREDVDAAVEAVDDIAFYLSLGRFADAYDMTRPTFTDGNGLAIERARNLGLVAAGETVQPVTYALGEYDLDLDPDPDHERVAVLTGANSGGKTTLLETVCQVVLLASMGLPVPAERAQVTVFDDVVFHRRHASFNAGVLESTLRTIVPPLADEGRTLMLVDEFEAITEPGSAADLLHGLVQLTVGRDALGAFVTHLAEDLEPLPEAARVDGIFAEGLDADLDLEVDYQPRFHTLGKSTPEFIVSRLVADAADRTERSGYETLAEAVGSDVVQRTLADARWSG